MFKLRNQNKIIFISLSVVSWSTFGESWTPMSEGVLIPVGIWCQFKLMQRACWNGMTKCFGVHKPKKLGTATLSQPPVHGLGYLVLCCTTPLFSKLGEGAWWRWLMGICTVQPGQVLTDIHLLECVDLQRCISFQWALMPFWPTLYSTKLYSIIKLPTWHP